jgi:DNA-binding response OmpR family regulator
MTWKPQGLPGRIYSSFETRPGASWLWVIKETRKITSAVLLVLFQAFKEDDVIEAIEAGADDYIHTPINSPLFVTRVRAALRRRLPAEAPIAPAHCGALDIDPDRYEAVINGNALRLTATEFKILHLMAQRGGSVTRKGTLRDLVWGGDDPVLYDATLRKHIQSLRKKLAEADGSNVVISTIPGVGYKLTTRPSRT